MIASSDGHSIKDIIFRLSLQANPGNRRAADDTIAQAKRIQTEVDRTQTAQAQAAKSDSQRMNQMTADHLGNMRRITEYRRQDETAKAQAAKAEQQRYDDLGRSQMAAMRRQQQYTRENEAAARATEQNTRRIATAQQLAADQVERSNAQQFRAFAGGSRGGMVMGVTELARGFEFLGLAGGKANKEIVETILKLQGLTDIARGSMATIGGFVRIWNAVKASAEAAAAAQALAAASGGAAGVGGAAAGGAGATAASGATWGGMAAAAGITGASIGGGAAIGAAVVGIGALITAIIMLGEKAAGTANRMGSFTTGFGEKAAGLEQKIVYPFTDTTRKTPYTGYFGPFAEANRQEARAGAAESGYQEMLRDREEREERERPGFQLAARQRSRDFEYTNRAAFGTEHSSGAVEALLAQSAKEMAQAIKDQRDMMGQRAAFSAAGQVGGPSDTAIGDTYSRQAESAQHMVSLTEELGNLQLQQNEKQIGAARTALELYEKQAEKLGEQLKSEHEKGMSAKERLLEMDPFKAAQIAQSERRIEAGQGTAHDFKITKPFRDIESDHAQKSRERQIDKQINDRGLGGMFAGQAQKEFKLQQQITVAVGGEFIEGLKILGLTAQRELIKHIIEAKLAEALRVLRGAQNAQDKQQANADANRQHTHEILSAGSRG